MKRLFIYACLFLLQTQVFAQHHIQGKVLSADGKPLEFATLSIYAVNDSTDLRGNITKADGTFHVDGLKTNTYRLVVQMLAYQDWEQEIDLIADVDLGQIKLAEEATLLDAVEVVAEQSTLESRLGKKVLRIGQDLANTGTNALEALENIPSVSLSSRGQVQIRGNSNVIIYINGKETRRDPATLKYIASENLDRIEVITNPSAKYDAEGVAGIVNLVYKQTRSSKFKLEAITNLTALTNPFNWNPNGGLNASWDRNKLSFFTNISLDYGKYEDRSISTRTAKQGNLAHYENNINYLGTGLISNFNMGLALEPDTTLSMALEFNYDRWDLENEALQENIFDYRDSRYDAIQISNLTSELEDEIWINFSLEKELKPKHNLKLSLTTGGEDEHNFFRTNDLEIPSTNTSIQQFLLRSEVEEGQRYYQGKLDFEAPFFQMGTLEAGIKADFIQYDILQTRAFRAENLELPDNDFSMTMQKLGIYALQNHQIGKLEYSLGLRLEQFDSEAIQRADGSVFTQKYLRLFPSVQFNYLLPDQSHTIGGNYTRRINRPGFFDLNPFVSYEDPLNLETGNPALRPEIANLYEASYHRAWDVLSLDMTLYRRETADAIQEQITTIANDQSLSTPINFAEQISQGIEAQVEYRPTKSIKTTASFVLGQVQFIDPANEIQFPKSSTWNTRLKQEFKFKQDWKLALVGTYRAPRYAAQEVSKEVFYIDLNASKKFNNKRGSLSLGIRDIFNTRIYAYSLVTADFEVERSYKWQTRQLTLGLRYFIFKG